MIRRWYSAVHPWLVAILAAGGILVVAVELMKWARLVPVPDDATDAAVLAAVAGLIGAVLSALVTLFGIVLKFSIDRRAEESNRIDIAIRAVDLLSENNRDATKGQMGGALLSLVSLGERDLALALLADMWPDDKVTWDVATNVIDEAFAHGSGDSKHNAAIILIDNSSRIDRGDTTYWPLGSRRWSRWLVRETRHILMSVAAELLVAELADGVSDKIPRAATIIDQALDDRDPTIAGIAAACLEPIVVTLPDLQWSYTDSRGRLIRPLIEMRGHRDKALAKNKKRRTESQSQRAKELRERIEDTLHSSFAYPDEGADGVAGKISEARGRAVKLEQEAARLKREAARMSRLAP